MNKFLLILVLSIVALSCKNENTEEKPISETDKMAINYQSFGDKITDEDVLPNIEIMEKFKDLKPGDTINVKFISKVNEVCQKKGCWMKVGMGEEEAMVRFKDYGFFMPKDIAGKDVIVEGKAYVEEMSVDDQRHYAEDGDATPEEIAAITEPKRTLGFEANGVLIPEAENQ